MENGAKINLQKKNVEILANCDLRHPKVCRYMKKYKVCKYSDFCSYDHEVGDTTINRSVVEIDDLRKTMDEVKDIVEQQKLIINTLQLQVANLEIAHLNKNENVKMSLIQTMIILTLLKSLYMTNLPIIVQRFLLMRRMTIHVLNVITVLKPKQV